MIKYLLFFLPIFFLSCNAQDRQYDAMGLEDYCSYNETNFNPSSRIGQSTSIYDSLIREILVIIGIPNSDIQIETTSDFGAFAAITRDCRRRTIYFNEQFFDSVLIVTKSYNCIKSVCFHEVAHHFYWHPLKSSWEAHIHELEADRYSGFQMRVIGASLKESIAAMEHFGNESDSPSHPSKEKRIAEIKAGYIDASRRLFNDTTYFKMDSLLFNEELIFAFDEIKSSNKSFDKLEMESFKSNEDFDFNKVFQSPTYSFLGKILVVNENNEVLDLESNQVVGRISTPYKNATFELLKFETSTYRIENGTIYSITPQGTPIKLGTKIN